LTVNAVHVARLIDQGLIETTLCFGPYRYNLTLHPVRISLEGKATPSIYQTKSHNMYKSLTSFLTIAFVISTVSVTSADIWNGPSITFTKPDGADWTQPENQDQITPNVSITRKDFEGIFNIAQEDFYQFDSPADTEWAYGTTDDLGPLVFQNWRDWHGGNPLSTLDRDAVLHLISDDIYIDIRFTSWGVRGDGGFSYDRSTRAIPEPASGLIVLLTGGFLGLRLRR
jgi:hypothetical protein